MRIALISIVVMAVAFMGCVTQEPGMEQADEEHMIEQKAQEVAPAPMNPISIPQPLVSYPAPSDPGVVADQLDSPRQIFYDPEGVLYIAEAGIGGDSSHNLDEAFTVQSGLSSRISAVDADGTRRIIIPALPSIQTRPNSTGYRGAQAVALSNEIIWIAIGETVSTDLQIMPLFTTVIGIDRETLRLKHVVDTLGAEMEMNPGGAIIASDPVDLAVDTDGTLFIADAGANTVWRWHTSSGIQIFATWPIDDNPVPTSVALGFENDLYVGFLSGAPFERGSARIERWSLNGKHLETFGGLTLVTDILVIGDSIYAVEMGQGGGGEGSPFQPKTGRIVHVSSAGVEPIVEGLTAPYGLAQSNDGSLLVSVGSSFSSEPGTGSVIKVFR